MKSTYIIAVSGGIDSVALLHMFSKNTGHKIIVAHFDHGIRDDSASDALFVKTLADSYGFMFEGRREELGSRASEQIARDRRYGFLRGLAQQYDGQIVTAHHADDVVETIAINLTRGTGWRGLAVLDSDIHRPLLHMSKSEITEYVHAHQLEWREDSTNASDAYLRNRIRRRSAQLGGDEKRQLLALHAQQVDGKKQIDQQVSALVGEGPSYSRYFFAHIPLNAAVECLRYVTNGKLTRPQLERALLAIKTAKPKHSFVAGSGVVLDFTTRNFSLSLLK